MHDAQDGALAQSFHDELTHFHTEASLEKLLNSNLPCNDVNVAAQKLCIVLERQLGVCISCLNAYHKAQVTSCVLSSVVFMFIPEPQQSCPDIYMPALHRKTGYRTAARI